MAGGVVDWASPSREIGCGMLNLLRAAAEALANLAEKAHRSADWIGAADEFAGVDIVGIDFSTSIQRIAGPVIRGWDRFRSQMNVLHSDHGVWTFGVNSIPFPLTPRPVPPGLLPSFRGEHFQRRGDGPGLIEYGSAFHDYFVVALGHAQKLAAFDEDRRAPLPITISLLCDGMPNGGIYRASDVQPLLEEARTRGVRFKLVGFAPRKYHGAMRQFRESLGLTCEELEVAWYDEGTPDERSIASGFDLLSHF
jgi:hypothetical protein